ncbi:MAG: rod-binding protein [Campylobacter sp.]
MLDTTMAVNAYNNATNSLANKGEFKKADAREDALLREQTDAFEAFMVKAVLDVAIKNENPLFGKDAADGIYQSMYNDTMSKALSGNLGFSELLFNFLKERG